MSKWIILAAIAGVALLGIVALLKAWPMINIVETGQTPEYPDIQPRRYPIKRERVYDAALHAVNQIPRWTIVSHDEGKGEIRAEATTRLLRFVDDVRIRIETKDGVAAVNVRSASRVGRGDFGQNERNIRAFFAELDRQLRGNPSH